MTYVLTSNLDLSNSSITLTLPAADTSYGAAGSKNGGTTNISMLASGTSFTQERYIRVCHTACQTGNASYYAGKITSSDTSSVVTIVAVFASEGVTITSGTTIEVNVPGVTNPPDTKPVTGF